MKRTLFIMVVSALVAGFIMTAILWAQTPTTKEVVEVTKTAVNLRQGPATSFPVAGRATQGQTFDLLGEQGKWLKIKYGNEGAWVFGALVNIKPVKVTPPPVKEMAPPRALPQPKSIWKTLRLPVIIGASVVFIGLIIWLSDRSEKEHERKMRHLL